jgi:hypothetical protein
MALTNAVVLPLLLSFMCVGKQPTENLDIRNFLSNCPKISIEYLWHFFKTII